MPDIRTGRAAARAAALLSFALGASCAGPALLDEDLPEARRVVHERKAAPGAVLVPFEPATAAEGEAAADLAARFLADGDPAAALEVARRALERMPPREQADRLREVRAKAKGEFLRSAVARAEASAPARVAEGETFEVRVRLRNLAPVPLRVPEARPGISPTLVLLRVTRTSRDVFGGVRAETWEESHPLPPGEAPPGGALEAVLPFDTSRFAANLPRGFVAYEFGGTVVPSGVAAGDLRVHERIPVDPAGTLAFPQKGWEDVAADPAGHLERGLRAGNPVRLLLAAACLPPGERPAAGTGLARRLRDGPSLGPGLEASARAALRFWGGDPGADRWTVEAWEGRAAPAFAPEEDR